MLLLCCSTVEDSQQDPPPQSGSQPSRMIRSDRAIRGQSIQTGGLDRSYTQRSRCALLPQGTELPWLPHRWCPWRSRSDEQGAVTPRLPATLAGVLSAWLYPAGWLRASLHAKCGILRAAPPNSAPCEETLLSHVRGVGQAFQLPRTSKAVLGVNACKSSSPTRRASKNHGSDSHAGGPPCEKSTRCRAGWSCRWRSTLARQHAAVTKREVGDRGAPLTAAALPRLRGSSRSPKDRCSSQGAHCRSFKFQFS